MQTECRLSALLAGAVLVGCASTYDHALVDEREAALYGPPPMRVPDVVDREVDHATPAAPASEPVAWTELRDLEEYVAYGLQHSARLRSVFETWRGATERIEQVSTLPDPRLSYSEFIEEVQTRAGPQERRIGISQAFPWPGTLGAQARVAEHRAEALWHQVAAERLRVRRDIELAYHDYAFLGRELVITSDLLELLRGLEPVVQSKVRAGGGQEDLLRLQVEIGRLEDELASVERRRPAVSARLADALTLRGRLQPLPVPELVEPALAPSDPQRAYGYALEHNPELMALGEELEASREGEELARLRGRPSFSIGVDYFDTDEAIAPSTPDSGDDPVSVSLSLSIPVWRSSYSAAEREARHGIRASRGRIDSTASALRAAVENEAFSMDDAARRIGLYRDSLLPRADEAWRLTLASYRTGSASLLDLIDSERALLEFELSFWGACRDFLQGDARLRALTSENER